MISTSKAYNGLTGMEFYVLLPKEAKNAMDKAGIPEPLKGEIVEGIKKALDRAGINSEAITYPGATWSWSLTIRQKDSEGRPLGEKPEQHLEAGESGKDESTLGLLVKALKGGSDRFHHNPPSPTEVRQSEGLPVSEA